MLVMVPVIQRMNIFIFGGADSEDYNHGERMILILTQIFVKI